MKPNKIIDFEAEYFKVKKNNRNLAKALAEQQQTCKKYFDENIILQKKLYVASNLNMKYEKSIKEMCIYLKRCIKNGIGLTNDISRVIIMCNENTNIQKSFEYDNNKNAVNKVTLRSSSPGGPHKTHAVKPMVSGHVIHNPIINLSRLIETRVTGIQSAESSVQNYNSDDFATNSNHETINNNEILLDNNDIRNVRTTPLPIRGMIPEILDSTDSLDETDESLGEDSVYLDEENDESSQDVSNGRVSNLCPLDIINEEESMHDSINNNGITKEVRIMIEPLHLENINFHRREKCANIVQPEKFKAKRTNEDPLEGTSSMLDNAGNLISCNMYNSKPRQASKRMCIQYESDSEESSVAYENKGKRWVTKRKSPTEKKDITGQKYKVKRNKMSLESNNSLNGSLERSHTENNISNSSEEGDSINHERRSRRSAPKSLAEPSLKSKLRR